MVTISAPSAAITAGGTATVSLTIARTNFSEPVAFTAENLPAQTRDDPEQRKRHSMELMRAAPMDMGLGIKREAPRHY